ncbi:MAG: YggS family pyridoxal phosphate-dependent enzyme [Clostridia bacterium]|nr:YggS family pyridoxal phosphate-dependent enzyme [Clostridia bacterium]
MANSMLKENLEKVFTQIQKGNNLGEKIDLVGATKMQSAEIINEAISYGLKIVAENKVQEFREKNKLLIGCEQHFIGHLQTNKVKYLIGKVSLIHSVDSLHLAEEINKQAEKRNLVQEVLIEINVGNEVQKSGLEFSLAKEEVLKIAHLCPYIKVVGLMSMLPRSEDKNYLAELCKNMRELYDELKTCGLHFKHLSVGTSGDYEIAIANGSNMIRLGRTIFGERNYGEVK